MSSWNLLRHLFGQGQRYRHNPVFRHESWRRYYYFSRFTLSDLWVWVTIALSGIIMLLGFRPALSSSACLIMPICIPLTLWFMAYPLVVLTAVLTLAPVISRERLQGTWEILRVTPLPVETVILGKTRAALLNLQDQTIRILTGFTLFAGCLLTTVALLLQRSGPPLSDDPATNGGLILLLFASGLLFLAERAQQAALFCAAALVVSASARSTRMALAGTLASTIILWTADLMFVEILVRAFLRQADQTISPLTTLWLGSTITYGTLDSISEMYACIALTFLLREIAVRALWRWAVRAAQTI